ncbi:UDP-N-acetyl-D-glucosamine 2-epimerase, UDP-hydrolysing [Rheinheimera sp. SA_1]|uniref:UDP-N-acetylglucosamine 2-epimerase n=1 Tax=Rheinheimera sp. SA_1 TaxID=1827365 RepID=UPI0007FB9693|nr:UDP-N-acetylglucosamine 2-epimerase [Rheinheimera sp. SA_1]OBP15405.1 UDP-N-acetyl-D-glucosamine 2-epimerase, UDP-hydrolysing [Rheinheimera sp. SA_1]
MQKRKVLAVTGIRSEYDIMSSVYQAVAAHPYLDLALVVTGAHLSPAHGYTLNDIKADGFKVLGEIHSLLSSDTASSRVKGLAIQLLGLIQLIEQYKPDWLLVLGDREESMTTALAGAYMNIAVAHLCGGDRVVGNVDDQVRHAVSKLVHLHLTSNMESSERLLRMGEQPFRVHTIGNPGLDRLRTTPLISLPILAKQLNFPELKSPFIVVIQHVISTEIEEAYQQMSITMRALKKLNLPAVVIYPNSDAGGYELIRAIEEYRQYPLIHIAKNIPRLQFVNLLKHASCMVGNSSAGILEAPLLKLPVVNIGNRQKGRLHANNVSFVSHSEDEIIASVTRAVFDKEYRRHIQQCSNPYGDGHSSEKVAALLAELPLDANFMIKDITY